MIWLALISAAIWVYLLGFHGRFWQAGPVLAPAAPRLAPDVAIVVPARDEAGSIAACLTSLLAQDYAGAFRVILVDDGSADGTGDIARGLDDPRLSVVTGEARPAGWSGKLWAVRQGIAAALDAPSCLVLAPPSPLPLPRSGGEGDLPRRGERVMGWDRNICC